jgi:hypothetical protein
LNKVYPLNFEQPPIGKPAKYKPYAFRFGGIWIPSRTDVLTMMSYVQKKIFNGNKNNVSCV